MKWSYKNEGERQRDFLKLLDTLSHQIQDANTKAIAEATQGIEALVPLRLLNPVEQLVALYNAIETIAGKSPLHMKAATVLNKSSLLLLAKINTIRVITEAAALESEEYLKAMFSAQSDGVREGHGGVREAKGLDDTLTVEKLRRALDPLGR